mmetsp:Transcript_9020/g.26544  ORF Transcript_9020/g.26544 Transcript_9020/m.26544 type:complete len:253 (+) Transcript_9020:3-761(+)
MAECKACEFGNVIGAITALVVSMIGVAVCFCHRGPTEKALHAIGPGAAGLGSMSSSLSLNFVVILLLNVIGTAVICLSTFELRSLTTSSIMHCMTKSTSLCWWSLLSWCTFLVQLVMSNFVMVAFVMINFLAYVCHSGDAVVAQTQDLIWSIGNMTDKSGAGYNPWGNRPVSDTPIISLEKIVAHLNLAKFCGHAEKLDTASTYFWVGMLLTVVSQALMTTSLNGEKERVSVHEMHEYEASESGYTAAFGFS